jgi:hypothetical protein
LNDIKAATQGVPEKERPTVLIYPPLVKEDGKIEGVPEGYYQDAMKNTV